MGDVVVVEFIIYDTQMLMGGVVVVVVHHL